MNTDEIGAQCAEKGEGLRGSDAFALKVGETEYS